ncbi:hypothetical protein Tco_0681205 [Tanacetum coccineum]|uniref:Uncharacterized protein n=1 Tax=Tanacetum coccineum TaxID=301880 RepID=A0ABQ4XNH5_9ASTR
MSSNNPFDALNTIEEGDEHRLNGGLQIQVDYMVYEDNDSEVEEVYDETTTYMASTGFNVNKASKSSSGGANKSLYEQWKENNEDPYDDDDFDNPGLTNAQIMFANAFDINFRGQLR